MYYLNNNDDEFFGPIESLKEAVYCIDCGKWHTKTDINNLLLDSISCACSLSHEWHGRIRINIIAKILWG